MQNTNSPNRQAAALRPLYGRRYTDEWVGFLVLACIAIFAGAAIEAGVLRDWLQPPGELHILLPQTGVGGLSPGADVEVMGIHAGMVRRMRLNADGAMFAIAEIDPQAEPFIRQDSKAAIKLRYAVAGAAYVSLTRGTGMPLDWNYAVIRAATDPNPVDMLSQTIAEIREQILPILKNTQQVMDSLSSILSDLHHGKGNAGRLLADETLMKNAEAMLASLRETMDRLAPIAQRADAMLASTDGVLTNVRTATKNVSKASQSLPALSRTMADAANGLPALLLQARSTANELQKLITQVRGLWILGGGGAPPGETRRLPPDAIQP